MFREEWILICSESQEVLTYGGRRRTGEHLDEWKKLKELERDKDPSDRPYCTKETFEKF